MTFIRAMLDYVHPWPNAAGYLLGTQEWTAERNPQLVRNFVATSWFHDGRWGAQREPDLIAGYARWLAGQGVLATAGAWRGATTNEFLPEPAVRAVSAP